MLDGHPRPDHEASRVPPFVGLMLSPRPLAPPARLTGRELEVLQLIADGLDNKEMAARLHVSENTVKTHVRHLCRKLRAHGRSHAVAIAFRTTLLR
jgi:DNA-binding CsgD family transcriptional regulator